jgi:undecaprenyl-diphosphatase
LFLLSCSFVGIAQARLLGYSYFYNLTSPAPNHLRQKLNIFEKRANSSQRTILKIAWEFQEIDRELLEILESKNRYPLLDYTLETISLISPFIESITTLERCLRGYVKQDEYAKNIGIVAATALIGVQIINIFLKYAIDRDRPDLGARNYRPRLLNTKLTPSFPSGHTASSFVFANVIGSKYDKYKFPLFGYAALSGYSQMYVGNHYPSDVFVGALLGYSVGEITLRYDTVIIRTFLFF